MVWIFEIASSWHHSLVFGIHILGWWIHHVSRRIGYEVCQGCGVCGCQTSVVVNVPARGRGPYLSSWCNRRSIRLGEIGGPVVFRRVAEVLDGDICTKWGLGMRHNLWPIPRADVMLFQIVTFACLDSIMRGEGVLAHVCRRVRKAFISCIRAGYICAVFVGKPILCVRLIRVPMIVGGYWIITPRGLMAIRVLYSMIRTLE